MTEMSSSPMMESFSSFRDHFGSPPASPTKTETDLPAEVDQSFNSSMSLSMCDSPLITSPTPQFHFSGPSSPGPIQNLGFLSPTPSFPVKPRRPDPVPLQSYTANRDEELRASGSMVKSRELGVGRMFGRELSTNTRSIGPATAKLNGKGKMLPPQGTKPFAVKQRSAIPMQWTSSNDEPVIPKLSFEAPAMSRRESEPITGASPKAANNENRMDIDSPRASVPPSPSGFSGASSFGSPGLGSFFCESPVAPSALPPSKRRSLVASSPASPSSSPSAKRSALGLGVKSTVPHMDRATTSGGTLFGGFRANTIGARRPQPYSTRRPALAPVSSLDHEEYPVESQSASAVMVSSSSKGLLGAGTFPRAALAPMRRAFSVCDQPAIEVSEDESEFDGSPSMAGMHAQNIRRHQARTGSRLDGSPGFKKPMRSSIAVTTVSSQCDTTDCAEGPSKIIKQSPYGPGGLPGFGDNEMDGKILPCHKVKEDGLVRITSNTLDELISGKYASKIRRYHIIDCRFDYEYNGGHIEGAINVRSTELVDRLLLSAEEGVHANGESLPTPSRSGELKEGEQVVLVFHCEFSAKRAPTFAKHLRSKDRMINNAHYPKIFYPEVYILEGGYSGFFQACPTRCDPQAYVPMDDPRHLERRNSDLHDFRKFARTSSFTYGETQSAHPSSRALPCPPLAFAAANAAAARRGGPTPLGEISDRNTITEEDSEDQSPCSTFVGGARKAAARRSGGRMSASEFKSFAADKKVEVMEVPEDLTDSPCPPMIAFQAPLFGSARVRTLGRSGFSRTASEAMVTIRR